MDSEGRLSCKNKLITDLMYKRRKVAYFGPIHECQSHRSYCSSVWPMQDVEQPRNYFPNQPKSLVSLRNHDMAPLTPVLGRKKLTQQ
jgi:hypothetical protein